MHRYIIVKSLEFVVQCSTSTEYFGSDSESGSLSFDHFTKQLYYQNNVNNDHCNLCNLSFQETSPFQPSSQGKGLRSTLFLYSGSLTLGLRRYLPAHHHRIPMILGALAIVLITLYTALNGCLLLVVLTSYDLVQMRRTGRFTLYINASQFIKLMLMLTRVKKYIPILKCTVTTITYMHNKLTQFILLRYCNDVCTCIFV